MKLYIETIANDMDLALVWPRWAELANDNPFVHPLWSISWWQCFRKVDMQLRVLVVRTGTGEIVGIAPLYLKQSILMGRELRFLGDGSCCSEYLTIVTEKGLESEVVRALAEWLHACGCSERDGAWDVMDLDCFADDDPKIRELTDYLGTGGHCRHVEPAMGCWRIDCSQGWDEYLSRLSKSRRSKIRRLLRQVNNSELYRIRKVKDLSQFEEFMNSLSQLHQNRWQQAGEDGCFADPRFGRFLRQVGAGAIATGMGNFFTLEYQGQTIAVQFALQTKQSIFSYQVGVDTTTQAESPGMAMNAYLIFDAIERGISMVDFLRGDEPYKQTLRAERIPTSRVHLFARHPLATFRFGYWRTACEFKRIAKRWLKPQAKIDSPIEQEA